MIAKKIIVSGAGAGGLMAAGRAAEMGVRVTLLEKMERPAKKLLISGNTRCNVSNSRSLEDFIPMYGVNGRFLYHAFNHFFREDLTGLLAKHGVMTATEADGRIFPASGKASDVVLALMRYAGEYGAGIGTGSRVTAIATSNGRVSGVQTVDNDYQADAVVLATGGASYPHTGSSGEGYKIVEALGHTIVRLRPALAPLVLEEQNDTKALRGISLRNIRLTSFACPAEQIDIRRIPRQLAGRGVAGPLPRHPVIESRQGDIIFTHYGISGPAALLMSLPIVDTLLSGKTAAISIDLLPQQTIEQTMKELQAQFSKYSSRQLHNVLESFVTARAASLIMERAGIAADKKAGQVSATERSSLAAQIKGLNFNVKSVRPLAEAMVTAGGISLEEIDPHTMESRLVKGLFFCGEVMDIDADTGGYNLQAAFSTGYLAGESAARSL